jgi:hypothetical protein
MPHHANVGNEKGAQVALVTGEIPHTVHLVVHLFLGEEGQLLILNDGTAQLQVAVQLGRLVRPAVGGVGVG